MTGVRLAVFVLLVTLSLIWFRRKLYSYLYTLLYMVTRSARITEWIFALIFFPGVALHESSHWLAAKLLRVRTFVFSLRPEKMRDGSLRFGYVEISKTDPVRAALIGSAPLISGVILVSLIAFEKLKLDQLLILAGEVDTSGIQGFLQNLIGIPGLFLWMYLLFAISNAMFPSASDRRAWLPALGLLVVFVAVLYGIGLGGPTMRIITESLHKGVSALSGAFLITLVLDLMVVFVLWSIVQILLKLLPSP
jgi:hypothetical protein